MQYTCSNTIEVEGVSSINLFKSDTSSYHPNPEIFDNNSNPIEDSMISVQRVSKSLGDIRTWLDSFGFCKYFENFVLNGIVSMDIVKAIPINDAQLKSIGIKSQQDRIIIMHHVVLLTRRCSLRKKEDEEIETSIEQNISDNDLLIDEFIIDNDIK